MMVRTMFKKIKLDIAFWYLASIIVMAVCYALLSNKDFGTMFDSYYQSLLDIFH